MNASFFKCVYRFGLVAALLLGQVAPSQAAIFLSDEALAQSEVYAANFPQVGYVYAHSPVRGWLGGSGTLAVNSKTVITAAHVLAGDDGVGGGLDDVRFYTGPSVAAYTGFSFADHWNLHPEYVPYDHGAGSLFGDFDIATISLRNSIAGLEPVQLYAGQLALGMPVSTAGFGVAGTNATGEVIHDQTRRAGTNVISGFGGETDTAYWSHHPNFSFVRFDSGPFSGQTMLEWQSSHGDSGGGWFVGNELAAVNSFTYGPMWPGLIVGNSSGAVQVSLFSGWLNQMATTSVPEPSSFAFMLVAAGLGAASRRFRSARE